ncbi:hypothetical protein FRC07_003478 [Ceratobasidium sp. 392]|nr:hypothetical protein FRC07_003478 [Ceratobasidium sp. 392]
MQAPTDNTRWRRWRTIRDTTKLLGRTVAKLVVIPGVQDSTRTMRGVIADLKPTIFQAPKENDAAVRQALAQVEKIQNDVMHIEETTDELSAVDGGPSTAQYRYQLQELCDFLQVWEAKLGLLLDRSYLAKVTSQDEISQQLSEHSQELANRLGRLQVSAQTVKKLRNTNHIPFSIQRV